MVVQQMARVEGNEGGPWEPGRRQQSTGDAYGQDGFGPLPRRFDDFHCAFRRGPFPLRNLKAEYAAACDDNYDVDRLPALFVQDATWESEGMASYAGREAMWRAGLGEEEHVRVDGRRM